MSTYETKAGDYWDVISKEVYDSEMHTDLLISANIEYAAMLTFPAGIKLNVPDLEIAVDYSNLPPWKR